MSFPLQHTTFLLIYFSFRKASLGLCLFWGHIFLLAVSFVPTVGILEPWHRVPPKVADCSVHRVTTEMGVEGVWEERRGDGGITAEAELQYSLFGGHKVSWEPSIKCLRCFWTS